MLGPCVNALSVDGLLRRLGLRRGDRGARRSRWEAVALAVMRRPFAVLIPVLAGLFILGSPFFRLAQGVPDATVYPAGTPSRDAWVALVTEFRVGETTPIVVLVDPIDDPTSAAGIAAGMQYGDQLAGHDQIDRLEGPFWIPDPATGKPMTAAQS